MKILAICFKYGTNSPGGIINKSILENLSINNDVKIIVAYSSNNDSDTVKKNLYACSPYPNRPHRLFELLGNLFSKNIDDIFWESKAKTKIRKILKNWQPDVIYARGQPLSPLNVGYAISKKYSIPLMIHFSDPLPAPIEWKSDKNYRNKILNGIKPILKHVNKLSFVTDEMIKYQEDVSGVNIKDKSVTLYNPISGINLFDAPPTEKFIFLYIGSFYGNRKPDTLINSFIEFSSKYNFVELHIVGNNNHLIHYNSEKIKILPYSTNPIRLMQEANALIDVDSNSKNEVFLSSKLLDYLSTNRIIISITPNSSPARKLLSDLSNTVKIASHDNTEIVDAFEQALNTTWTTILFDERKKLQLDLNLKNIVRKTEQELFSISKKSK